MHEEIITINENLKFEIIPFNSIFRKKYQNTSDSLYNVFYKGKKVSDKVFSVRSWLLNNGNSTFSYVVEFKPTFDNDHFTSESDEDVNYFKEFHTIINKAGEIVFSLQKKYSNLNDVYIYGGIIAVIDNKLFNLKTKTFYNLGLDLDFTNPIRTPNKMFILDKKFKRVLEITYKNGKIKTIDG